MQAASMQKAHRKHTASRQQACSKDAVSKSFIPSLSDLQFRLISSHLLPLLTHCTGQMVLQSCTKLSDTTTATAASSIQAVITRQWADRGGQIARE